MRLYVWRSPAGDLLSLRVVVQDASPAAHAFVVDVSLDEVVTVGELQPYDSSFVLSARLVPAFGAHGAGWVNFVVALSPRVLIAACAK